MKNPIDANLDKPRTEIMWAVEYTEEQECECGFTHTIKNTLVGLPTKAEAEHQAEILKGHVTRRSHTPKLSDEELKLLNDNGIPAQLSVYGLTFKGLPVAYSERPNSLLAVKNLYNNVKSQHGYPTHKKKTDE